MHGYLNQRAGVLTKDLELYEQSKKEQENANEEENFDFKLKVMVHDVEKFVKDPSHQGTIEGLINTSVLNSSNEKEQFKVNGIFNLFTNDKNINDDIEKLMVYTLFFEKEGKPYTFLGFKVVHEANLPKAWDETTTLYSSLFEGKQDIDIINVKEFPSVKSIANGVLRLNLLDFAKQMSTFKVKAPSPIEQMEAMVDFGSFFMGSLWESYKSYIFESEVPLWRDHIVNLDTSRNIKNCDVSYHKINTDDKISLELIKFKRSENSSDKSAFLMHGLTGSSEMFTMPEHYNIVSYLLDNGYGEVWCLNWRGSNKNTYNYFPHRYTLDDIAKYDVKAAWDYIVKESSSNVKVDAIVQCVGSLVFFMAAASYELKNLNTIVSNAVSLNPRVPAWSKLKIKVVPNLLERLLSFTYMSPKFYKAPRFTLPWVLAKIANLFHHECNSQSCHMMSLMWGTGWPACYEHKNISEVTHHRLDDIYGGTAFHFYRHIGKMISKGKAVQYKKEDRFSDLPVDYLEAFNKNNKNKVPVLLMRGKRNKVFTDSNEKTYQEVSKDRPETFYKCFDDYGHMDVFMGTNSHKDIFPTIVNFTNNKKL
jgi:triacylglycerol lipase/cholesterol oxidase